jgi:hypothetical protein
MYSYGWLKSENEKIEYVHVDEDSAQPVCCLILFWIYNSVGICGKIYVLKLTHHDFYLIQSFWFGLSYTRLALNINTDTSIHIILSLSYSIQLTAWCMLNIFVIELMGVQKNSLYTDWVREKAFKAMRFSCFCWQEK